MNNINEQENFIKALGQVSLIVNASKGIGEYHNQFDWYSNVFKRLLPQINYAQLSGPTFANELAAGKISALTLGCDKNDLTLSYQQALNSTSLRVYRNQDIRGVEIGGALKNVLAIACGVSDGLELGHNARSALLTRGIAELTRIGVQAGGQAQTFLGLSGVGDCVLTCTIDNSRNRQFGIKLAKTGLSVTELLQQIGTVEGVQTASKIPAIESKYQCELPIMHSVYKMLYEAVPVSKVLAELLARPYADE